MGYILPVLSVISNLVSVGTKVAQGGAAIQEAEDEAVAITEQGDLAKAENEVEAERLQVKGNKFLARQKLAFMKGGVTLEGSPLLILEETQDEVDKEVQATLRSGVAQQSFAQSKARKVVNAGRGKLFGSLASAGSTGVQGILGIKEAFFS